MLVRRLLSALGLFLLSSQAHAEGIDDKINEIVAPIVNPFVGMIFSSIPLPFTDVQAPWIVIYLVIAAVFFTFFLGFINVRGFGHAVNLVRGAYTGPNDKGEVSHFQALATALSGTVGLGNIAGVAVAVSIGGAGATFWMILAGLLGMSTKFVECSLGVKYRNTNPDGSVSGGPMYYLSKGLSNRGNPALGRTLAVLFSIFAIGGAVGGGNMFQANQAFQQVVGVTGGEASFLADKGWLFGLVMAAIVGFVIIGGIKSIAKVTEKVVPFMALVYVGAALVIILTNLGSVGDAFAAIFNGAFTGVELTSAAFESSISWFPYILVVAVVLFAFSTMISWSYYGLKAWTYLFGESTKAELTFKIIFCGFVVIGASMNLGPVIDFSDAMIFAMALVNIVGLYILSGEIKKDMEDYLARLSNGSIVKYK